MIAFVYLDVDTFQHSQKIINSGGNCESNVSGCSEIHGPYDICSYSLVRSIANYCSIVFFIHGTWSKYICWIWSNDSFNTNQCFDSKKDKGFAGKNEFCGFVFVFLENKNCVTYI